VEPVAVDLELEGWSPVVYAKDQPEYLPLPSLKHADGRVMTRWRFTAEERKRIGSGADVFLQVYTFNQALQPLLPSVAETIADTARKDNCGQYHVTISEGMQGRHGPLTKISGQTIDDPFIRSTIRPKGWRVALAVLLRRYEVVVRVGGEPAAYGVVFGGDYTPDVQCGPAWNATVGGEEKR
jgi:hypothetical protein